MPHLSRTAGYCAAVVALALAGCSSNASSPAAGGDVASVNGQKISRSEFVDKLESGPGGKQTLNTLVQAALVDQYIKENKIEVSNADVDKKFDEIKTRLGPQFDAIKKQQGLSDDDIRKLLREQVAMEKAVGKDVKITDADVKKYLDANHPALDKPEQVHARHILVADEATVKKVEDKLHSGAKFEDVAKESSTDPSSKAKGGDLGTFSRQQMVKPFADAAFSQKINEIGPPVKSPFGWHVIQVTEHKPAEVASMANSHDKIKDLLTQQQLQVQIPVFMNTLRNKAKIEIYDPKLKDAASPLPGGQPPPAK